MAFTLSAQRGELCSSLLYDLTVPVPLLLKHGGDWDCGSSHMYLVEGLDMGSPYLHLHSPDLALSRGSEDRAGVLPSLFLSKSPLRQHALSWQLHHIMLGSLFESLQISNRVTCLLFFNSIQDYLYSAFYDTVVTKQLYRELSFYNRFISLVLVWLHLILRS